MSNKPQDADSKQPDSSFIQLDDAAQKDAASAASAPRRKALVAGLTAACIVLIAVSLGFVRPSSSGAWSIDWIVRTVTGESVVTKGATVYDALCALGLSVNAHGSSYGTYVAAIGGLAEKEHGGTSGWMYSVNGVTPNTACSNYVLSNGDNVVWYYVTG